MRARLGAGLGHSCLEVPVGMLPPVGHFLIDFLNLAVAQSQPQLYLLPSCQALVVQLGGGQHLQACLSHRSADQGLDHWLRSHTSFQKRNTSCSPLPESLLHERTSLRLATQIHPHVLRARG